MNSKHTPGPWTVNANGINSPDGHIVFFDVSGGPHETDARLIAAAPELLAALLRLQVATGCLYDGDAGRIPSIAEMEAVTFARRDAYQAIAKATNQQA